MILPFVPTPEDLELKISIKEGEQVIDLANEVVKQLNTKWDPETNLVPIYYSTSKYNKRVVTQVIDALGRGGWKAVNEPSSGSSSSSESAYINVSKNVPPKVANAKVSPKEKNLDME